MNNFWIYRKDCLTGRSFYTNTTDFLCNYIIEIMGNGSFQIWDIRKYSNRWDPSFYCYGRVGKPLKNLSYVKRKVKKLKEGEK